MQKLRKKDFIKTLKENLKGASSLYYKAWPSDFTIYKLSDNGKKAWVSWGLGAQGWLSINKIAFCCKAWVTGNSLTAKICSLIQSQFERKFERKAKKKGSE